MFSLICAWTNGWVNNRGAGDLRHNCAHYDVMVMSTQRLAHQALVIGLKIRNISRPWPNISSSEGSQDTSTCQTSGHYCHAFSIKYGNHTFEMFHWVKMPRKLVKSADRCQNMIRWSGYSSIWYFRPLPHAFSRKYPKTLNLTRFTRFFWPVWPWNLPYDLGNLGATSSWYF